MHRHSQFLLPPSLVIDFFMLNSLDILMHQIRIKLLLILILLIALTYDASLKFIFKFLTVDKVSFTALFSISYITVYTISNSVGPLS